MFDLAKHKVKIIAGLILAILAVGFVVGNLYFTGHNEGYAPTQPLPYSHKIHAGDNKIPCLYCHSNADNSKHATVPGLSVCMNCHVVVTKQGSPLIKQVQQQFQKGEAIEWVRVHDMADHVQFNHSPHVNKGVACQTCHGPIETMDVVKQDQVLNMGQCVTCHRDNGGPTDCMVCHK